MLYCSSQTNEITQYPHVFNQIWTRHTGAAAQGSRYAGGQRLHKAGAGGAAAVYGVAAGAVSGALHAGL